MLKKTFLFCALAAATAGCVDNSHNRYVPVYQQTPACGCAQQITSCTSCQQTIQTPTCGCMHHHAPKPKTIVIMVPPAPQPVIEHEIILQAQPAPTCGCKKCGCKQDTQ